MPTTVIAASIGSPTATTICTAAGIPLRWRRAMAYAGVIDQGRGGRRARAPARDARRMDAPARLGSEHLFEERGNVVVAPVEDRADHLDPHAFEVATGALDLGNPGPIGLDHDQRRVETRPEDRGVAVHVG